MLLDDERLIWACVEPMIIKTRGRSGPEKLMAYGEMSDGQRALFIFQVLYGHMKHGINGFYDHISYLTSQMDIWSALKSGMRYFGLDEMADLIGKMEEVYVCRAEGRVDPVAAEDLDAIYRKLLPALVMSISERIRNHPEDFLRLED